MLTPCQKGKLIVTMFSLTSVSVSFTNRQLNRQHLQKLFSSLDYFNSKKPDGLPISASVLHSKLRMFVTQEQ